MEIVNLTAQKRQKVGKGIARQLRRKGYVPAVIYRGGDSLPIQLDSKEFSFFINKTGGEQLLVNLNFPDETKQALIKDYQTDPIKGTIIHADFQEVTSTETVRVMVHIIVHGEPVGVKRDNGILQYGLREIEIEGLPQDIPGHIDVDVSNLLIGQSVHVSDLKLGEKIRILSEPDELIATVTAIKEEVITEVSSETVEPEVIKKGKKTEEE
ncbi:MAG: 50S ribosomal protein L25 [Thermodesulfovibrionales bacterium]|nr:50S ribosomal protein L25 [Thermodesulfovibrionales bacterium]